MEFGSSGLGGGADSFGRETPASGEGPETLWRLCANRFLPGGSFAARWVSRPLARRLADAAGDFAGFGR